MELFGTHLQDRYAEQHAGQTEAPGQHRDKFRLKLDATCAAVAASPGACLGFSTVGRCLDGGLVRHVLATAGGRQVRIQSSSCGADGVDAIYGLMGNMMMVSHQGAKSDDARCRSQARQLRLVLCWQFPASSVLVITDYQQQPALLGE
jgi:hypothetical protein